MAVTYDQVRQIALGWPNVSEGQAYGGPSLHVGRKFLGRLREDGETLVLKVDPAKRPELLEKLPDAFFLTDHYRAYPSCSSICWRSSRRPCSGSSSRRGAC
jgi:hypothetical protein